MLRVKCRHREPSVKTLRFPFSAEFWKHYVLGERTQHCALIRHQREEEKKLNILLWNTFVIQICELLRYWYTRIHFLTAHFVVQPASLAVMI